MSKGWLLGFCEKKQRFQKGKGLPRLECFGWAHIAAISGFGGDSILGGHCANKGGGNSSSGGKPHFFKLLTLQHFLKCFC